MGFLETLAQQFSIKPIDWDELEESLIRADLGVPMTTRIMKKLQDQEAWSLLGIGNVIKTARDEIGRILPDKPAPLRKAAGKPTVILIVGVNGTGKTTSTAKLANLLKDGGTGSVPSGQTGTTRRSSLQGEEQPRIILAAADTFRAAAIEQLGIWSERLGIEMIKGQYNADPAALCYEAYQAATKKDADFLICDTAGRQHTKSNLMAELEKVKRTLTKLDPEAPHEILLVVDATTGGNALSQAREFNKTLGLTGLIVTKLDGSGKGGIVVAIQEEFGIPTRFVGIGEKIEDFAPFDADEFVGNML